MIFPERLDLFSWLLEERWLIKERRDNGQPGPWTLDPILAKYHFCNVFRAHDRTSRVIYAQTKKETDAVGQLTAVFAGRLINKASTLTTLYASDWRRMSEQDLAEFLVQNGINTNAYRINTPQGLNSRSGIAELIRKALDFAPERTRKLLAATSLQEAQVFFDSLPFVGRFIGYQIIQDLADNGFWPSGFDVSHVVAGPGAVRGYLWLTGVEQDPRWESAGFRHDRIKTTRVLAELAIPDLTTILREKWPSYRPLISVHETEFMLCELDKYVRKSTGAASGRLFHSRQ